MNIHEQVGLHESWIELTGQVKDGLVCFSSFTFALSDFSTSWCCLFNYSYCWVCWNLKKKVDKTKCTNVYRKIPYTRSGFAELSFCIFHYKKLPISSNQSNPSHTDLPAVYIYKWLKLISCPFFLCHFYTYCKKNDREQSKVDLTDFSFVWTFRISLMHLATLPHSLDPFHRRNE